MLFVGMTRMIDGSWILDQMLRVFPLQRAAVADLCEEWEHQQAGLLTIEGTVGYLGRAGFVALPEAQMMGEYADAPPERVEVSDAGEFRFAMPFEGPRPERCADRGSSERQSPGLRIQAPGCSTRRVPVTPDWVPHRVLLDCEAQS